MPTDREVVTPVEVVRVTLPCATCGEDMYVHSAATAGWTTSYQLTCRNNHAELSDRSYPSIRYVEKA